MSTKTPHVAIIGGGIGGLTLGLALRARGITFDIHEQTPELREVGAAVALSANGTRLLRRLGVGDQLDTCSAVPTELIYRHWQDGHRIAAHEAGPKYEETFGAPYYGVHRADLQRILAEACGQEHVHLNSRLCDLTPTADAIRMNFTDGSTARADLVVGADGVHSTVRGWITDEDTAVYSGTSGFRGLIPVEQLPNLPDPGAIQFWMGPGAHLLHYPIGNGEIINFLAVVEGPAEWTEPSWATPTTLEQISSLFADWHPGASEMVSATPLHQRWALFSQTPLSRWSRGRAVLLGDAAHAMLPHHGQGANQTIEDAVTLADCLAATSEPTEAIRRYEELRRTRTRQIQRSSWVASDLLHLPVGPEAEQRDANLAHAADFLTWIHSHDVEAPPGPR